MTNILALTNSYDDAHVQAVRHHIEEWGHNLVRINVDDLLRGEQSISWDFDSSRICVDGPDASIDLNVMDHVWFRKPFGFGSRFGFAEFIRDPIQKAVLEKEVSDLVNGLAEVLSDRPWTNHPLAIQRARLKPLQLALAKKIGFHVPETIITSDPNAARAFCAEGPTVFKALAVQQFDYEHETHTIDTTLMTPVLIDQLELIRAQPVLLQRCIPKSAEIRVTCVGGLAFAAKQTLATRTDEPDWRKFQGDDRSSYEPWPVPEDLRSRIVTMMEILNLTFAAVDFAVDQHGSLLFLEINPNGQWLGYTDHVGIPAARLFARHLVS